eukprot:6179527-Pleurochrysis_carterae.AAC.1
MDICMIAHSISSMDLHTHSSVPVCGMAENFFTLKLVTAALPMWHTRVHLSWVPASALGISVMRVRSRTIAIKP